MLMVNQLSKVYQEFPNLEEGFTLRLKTYKDILTVLEYTFYRLQKGFFQIAKQESKVSVEKFYANQGCWQSMKNENIIGISEVEMTDNKSQLHLQ